MGTAHLLVIDDEPGIRSGVREILCFEGYSVDVAASGREALELSAARPYDVVFIDYRLPDIDGLTLLQSIHQQRPSAMTCMITAYANIETAIAATRQGIDFFLPKPFTSEDLLGVVDTLLRHKKLRDEAELLRVAHEQSLRELASEKSQTHSLVASLRDGVLVVNRDGEIVLANRAMAELLGTDPTSLEGQSVRCALVDGALAPALSAFDPIDPGSAVFEVDVETRRLFVNVSGFRDGSGTLLGQIVTAVDISAVRRLALEKARFTRTLVHELRAPLGAVKSMIEVVRDKSLGGDLDPYLPFLARADQRLDGLADLVSDLLSLSRLDYEAAASAPNPRLDVAPIIAEVAELWRDRAAQIPVILSLDISEELPRPAIAEDDLRTILTNLLGNAIKYNRPNGSVTLCAQRTTEGLFIAVRDTGIGIAAESLPHLTDEFFREKRQQTRGIDGNGLGLAIVKRLVDRAGGRLEISSLLGQGSEFRLILHG